MSLRMTLTAALGLALALPTLVNANPNGKRGESAGKEASVTRVVYPVAELVVPIDYGDGKYCDQTQQERLMELIKATVAPKSWKELGGAGTMQYAPKGMALIVNQRREVQGEILDLISALRRLQDVEVAVEVRIVRMSAEMGERFRRKAGFEASKSAAVEQFVGTPIFALGVQCAPTAEEGDKAVDAAVFTAKELYPWLELFQTDAATQFMQAPKVTLFNGQRTTLDAGLKYTLRPTVSSDYRSVLVNAEISFTPQSELVAFKQTSVIPDGRTMAVSLGKMMVDARQESAVPVLSKIPYVSRLFRTVGWSKEACEVFLFVTPRVIVNEETEQVFEHALPFDSALPPLPRP